jgi:hypothetical protein
MENRIENRYKFKYDLKTKSVLDIRFQEGDTDSATLEVILTDKGIAIDLTDQLIEFRFIKADGNVVYQDEFTDVTVLDATGGIVECILKNAALSFPGNVRCEIYRSGGGKDQTIPAFNFKVTKTIGEDGTISINYISSIESKILEMSTLLDEFNATNVVSLQADIDNQAALLADNAYHVKGVGDGTTDDTQSFIDALLVSDIIFVPRGKTYLIGNIDVIGKTVIGHGTIKKISTAESAFHIKGDGVIISGLTFDAQSTSGQPSTDIKLGEGAKNVIISNNIFTSKIYSAITGAVDTLATPTAGTPYTIPVSGVIISNNVFKKLDTNAVGYARPLFLHSIGNITIEGNVIRDTDFDAIRLRENVGHCLINANQFINIGNPAWVDDQTRDAVDVHWSGDTLTITNNIVKVTAYTGFDIKGIAPDGSHKTQKVIISNNQIEKTRYSGIFLRGDEINPTTSGYGYIDSVIVSDNIIQECNQGLAVATNASGIRVQSLVKYLNIHDNILVSNLTRAIFVNNTSNFGVNTAHKITGNMCINNGRDGVSGTTEAGIHVSTISGVILNDNICENDLDLPNPFQSTGIYFESAGTGGFTPSKTSIIRGNICRNNLTNQLVIGQNNNRADNIAIFGDNVQVGTGAIDRPTWQEQRSQFWGTGIPVIGDGVFRKGDVIFNTNPSIVDRGNKYIIEGWKRISVNGNTHTLGVDWVEMRVDTETTQSSIDLNSYKTASVTTFTSSSCKKKNNRIVYDIDAVITIVGTTTLFNIPGEFRPLVNKRGSCVLITGATHSTGRWIMQTDGQLRISASADGSYTLGVNFSIDTD